MADFEDFEQQAYKIRKEIAGLITYMGYAINQDTVDSDAKWIVKRIAVSGGQTTIEYASQKFDKKFSDRATLFGAPPFDNENSLLFDGTNDYCNIGNVAGLSFERTNSFSVSLWARMSATSEGVLFAKQAGGNAAGYRIVSDGGRFKFHMAGTGGAGDRIEVQTPLSTYNDSMWRSVVFTYDGTSLASGVKCYVNASLITLTVNNDTLTTSILNAISAMFGARNVGGTNNFDGFLDELAVWNTVLDQTDVNAIYNSGVVGDLNQHAKAANLISWWRCGDNDTFPTIEDRSNVGNNLDATMTNMVAGSIVGEVP